MEIKKRKAYSSMQFSVKKFDKNEDIVRLSGTTLEPGSFVDVGKGDDPGLTPPDDLQGRV